MESDVDDGGFRLVFTDEANLDLRFALRRFGEAFFLFVLVLFEEEEETTDELRLFFFPLRVLNSFQRLFLAIDV